MVYVVISGYLEITYHEGDIYNIHSLSIFDTLEAARAYIFNKIGYEVPCEECKDIGADSDNLELGPGWVIVHPGTYNCVKYFIVERTIEIDTLNIF